MATRKGVAQLFYTMDSYGMGGGPRRDTEARLVYAYQTWLTALSQLNDLEMLQAATAWCLSGAEFWPRPGALVEMVPRFAGLRIGADLMWGKVSETLRHPRGRRLVPGQDYSWHESGAVHAATMAGIEAVGGWPHLQQQSGPGERGIERYRIPFCTAYREAMKDARARLLTPSKAAVKQLTGETDLAQLGRDEMKTLTHNVLKLEDKRMD